MKLRASGWPLILLSRKSGRQQNATVEYLISAGYSGWTSLIMRYCYLVAYFKTYRLSVSLLKCTECFLLTLYRNFHL